MKCAEQPPLVETAGRNWSLVSGGCERRLETSNLIRYAIGKFRVFPSLSERHEKAEENRIIFTPIKGELAVPVDKLEYLAKL